MSSSINRVNENTTEVSDFGEKQQPDFSLVDPLMVKVEIVYRRKIQYSTISKVFKKTPAAICKALDGRFKDRRLLEGVARWLVATGSNYTSLLNHETKLTVVKVNGQD